MRRTVMKLWWFTVLPTSERTTLKRHIGRWLSAPSPCLKRLFTKLDGRRLQSQRWSRESRNRAGKFPFRQSFTSSIQWKSNWQFALKMAIGQSTVRHWTTPHVALFCLAISMNQFISVYELMNLYLYYNSDQKTSPEYTLKLQNQYKTTFFFPTVRWRKRDEYEDSIIVVQIDTRIDKKTCLS